MYYNVFFFIVMAGFGSWYRASLSAITVFAVPVVLNGIQNSAVLWFTFKSKQWSIDLNA